MGIKLGPAPECKMPYDAAFEWAKPALKDPTDEEFLTHLATNQLGPSEVELLMLPRKTNFAVDVARGLKFEAPEQIATVIANILGAWSVWQGLAINFVGLTIVGAAFYATLMAVIFKQPLADAWWRAHKKQLEAEAADDVRRLGRAWLDQKEEDARRLVGVEVLKSRLLQKSVEQRSPAP